MTGGLSIGFNELLRSAAVRPGLIKCRLIHMNGRSVVQPDILFSTRPQKRFFVPKFFDPNQIAFFDDAAVDSCRFTMVTENGVLLRVGFFRGDKINVYPDGSILYRCKFAVVEGSEEPKALGSWRRKGNDFQLQLFHHTNEAGFKGIRKSKEIWGSRRNIQGNLWLNNIGYGYFTSLKRIRKEKDLFEIAMSSSGLTGLVPTNAPFDPQYARMIQVPVQTAIDRAHTITVWINCKFLAANHLWLHRPMDQPAYYEVVLPKVFRVGLQPGANMIIKGNEALVLPNNQKSLQYTIVGDADSHEGLEAPFHEEETTSIALVEQIAPNDDIIAFWFRHSNSDQVSDRVVEFAQLEADDE